MRVTVREKVKKYAGSSAAAMVPFINVLIITAVAAGYVVVAGVLVPNHRAWVA